MALYLHPPQAQTLARSFSFTYGCAHPHVTIYGDLSPLTPMHRGNNRLVVFASSEIDAKGAVTFFFLFVCVCVWLFYISMATQCYTSRHHDTGLDGFCFGLWNTTWFQWTWWDWGKKRLLRYFWSSASMSKYLPLPSFCLIGAQRSPLVDSLAVSAPVHDLLFPLCFSRFKLLHCIHFCFVIQELVIIKHVY